MKTSISYQYFFGTLNIFGAVARTRVGQSCENGPHGLLKGMIRRFLLDPNIPLQILLRKEDLDSIWLKKQFA